MSNANSSPVNNNHNIDDVAGLLVIGVKTFYECNPMLDVGDANDIAQAVVYFAADSGKFVTGELINVEPQKTN